MEKCKKRTQIYKYITLEKNYNFIKIHNEVMGDG